MSSLRTQHHLLRKVSLAGVLLLSINLVGLVVVGSTASYAATGETETFTSSQIGSSGETPQFTETGNWQLTWTYNCSNIGQSGNFSVSVNQPSTSTTADIGPNELGPGGSGTDYYTDTGVFSLTVISECDWSISVSPQSEPAPAPSPSSPVQPSPGCVPFASSAVAMAPTADNKGYWIADVKGHVDACGDAATSYGELAVSPAAPIVGMAVTPDGGGYYLVGSDGGIFTFGDARYYGSVPGLPASERPPVPVVGMAVDPSGQGYWEVTSAGDVYSFGDAQFYGSTGNIDLAKPIVGMAVDPKTGGYWLVGADGGVFAFNAPFDGSLPGLPASEQPGVPVVAIAGDPVSGGYWEVTTAGDIYSFGGAAFYGSTGNIDLAKPIVGMSVSSGGGGYRMVAADGGIFDFGNAPYEGSAA
jgi:hypothetical protein